MQNSKNNSLLEIKGKVLLITVLYLSIVALFEGLKIEHCLLAFFYNLCIWITPQSRKFILAFSVFVVFGLIYDFMKVYPNYLVNSIDISPVYHFEKSVFGFVYNGILVTPNEFFAAHHTWVLDLVSGIFYINWMPVPLAFGVWLYYTNRQQFLNFSLVFLFVNLIGFCIYYIHPAAPPWYVANYGFDADFSIGGQTAGLERFDQIIGFKLFGSIYSRNSNVFAAMPSLHCSYPVVVMFYALKVNVKWMRYIFALFMVGIWFSAVYSGHHYVTDVIAGITCACVGIAVFEWILLKQRRFQQWIENYTTIVS